MTAPSTEEPRTVIWPFTPEQFAYWTIGWCEGHAAGVAVTEASYQAWLGVAREALSLPTQAELERARAATDEPCPAGRRDLERVGRVECGCSRCIRYGAVQFNLVAYGGPDYPGRDLALAEADAARTELRELCSRRGWDLAVVAALWSVGHPDYTLRDCAYPGWIRTFIEKLREHGLPNDPQRLERPA